MECDFCSNPKVAHKYQCVDFNAESEAAGVIYDGTQDTVGPTNLVLHSISFWAACEDCQRFIEADDMKGLLKHVTTTFDVDGQFEPERRRGLIRHLRHTYELFFKNRIRVSE